MSDSVDTAFQRARRPEQREHRRQAILDAATALLAEMPAAEISLRELGRRVGLSKSNVIRYFETREAVFLELLDRFTQEWLDALDQELSAPPVRGTPPSATDQVATTWARSLAQRPFLCELWSILSAVLERNVSVDAIRAFKLKEVQHRTRLARMINARIPELDSENAMRLATTSIIFTMGLWPIANPSPAVTEATRDPRLADSCIDFTQTLRSALNTTITGLLHRPGS
ncbi:TetR/AcrR family transcriptional regulator [Streptomyces sp. NBC_01433]|uniref:TetR/AcrR family transcriptional regulator n=1 Tax=Streptomyces sp. NBC_01433 TaxID=2903864 RepID=UPI0022580BFE|nr:TetR/AcrR family transcriptional regulator [Streptomyces sp. NBC_01433]MCX4679068.1 TetR/AcrR family transcriptional regulator [Streptomyces sp. NBC_01433]